MLRLALALAVIASASAVFRDFSLWNIPEHQMEAAIAGMQEGAVPKLPELHCSLPQLKSCQHSFAEDVGRGPEIFTDVYAFSIFLFDTYRNSDPESLLKLCNAQTSFRRCLGRAFHPCTDAFNIFRDQGLSLNESFYLAGVYDDIEFDCGSGFIQSSKHWNCISRVHNNPYYDRTMAPCHLKYQRTSDKEPKDRCDAGKELAECLALNFHTLDHCTGHDITWWACERALRRSKVSGFCSHATCREIIKNKDEDRVQSKTDFLQMIHSGGMFSDVRLKMIRDGGQKAQMRAAKRAAAGTQ